MEIAEAIEFFKERIEVASDYPEIKKYSEALKVGIQALEKQIPKKVVNKEKVTTSEDAEAYGADALFGECPVCKLTQSSVWNDEFCGDCGQRLDWSEESEE